MLGFCPRSNHGEYADVGIRAVSPRKKVRVRRPLVARILEISRKKTKLSPEGKSLVWNLKKNDSSSPLVSGRLWRPENFGGFDDLGRGS